MRVAVVAIVLLLCISAVSARPLQKLRLKSRQRAALVPYTSIPQLMLPIDATALTLTLADGTITKSTDIEMVWQASTDSDSTIKEIHTLAGGEDSIVPSRTWVFLASSWDGLADWATDHADHIADYATVDIDSGIVEWKVLLRDGDEPDDANCANFATFVASGDLASAMLIASQYFTQDIALDSTSDAYAALALLTASSTLYAERLDTLCLGYKFFSNWDSPVSDVTVSDSASVAASASVTESASASVTESASASVTESASASVSDSETETESESAEASVSADTEVDVADSTSVSVSTSASTTVSTSASVSVSVSGEAPGADAPTPPSAVADAESAVWSD